MARTYKEVVKTTTRKELDTLSCDLCGIVAIGAEWERGVWSVGGTTVMVEVSQEEGESYPDGGSGTGYEIDLCPACFKDRLVPWLRSEGAVVEEKEWDW